MPNSWKKNDPYLSRHKKAGGNRHHGKSHGNASKSTCTICNFYSSRDLKKVAEFNDYEMKYERISYTKGRQFPSGESRQIYHRRRLLRNAAGHIVEPRSALLADIPPFSFTYQDEWGVDGNCSTVIDGLDDATTEFIIPYDALADFPPLSRSLADEYGYIMV